WSFRHRNKYIRHSTTDNGQLTFGGPGTPGPNVLYLVAACYALPVIDIHSHIMPEMDDGARSLEEALEMARVAVQDGIEQMVSTPHMFNGLSRNPEPSEVIDRVGALNQAVAAACGGRLRILPGNEVHVSHEIVRQV